MMRVTLNMKQWLSLLPKPIIKKNLVLKNILAQNLKLQTIIEKEVVALMIVWKRQMVVYFYIQMMHHSISGQDPITQFKI